MLCCSASPESAILFSDEMAAVVTQGHMAAALLRELAEKTTTEFQDSFLVESCDFLPSSSSSSLPLEIAFGLDSTEEGSIALNLLPLLEGGKAAQLCPMAAQFRLLRVCEQQLHANLESVDALLGEGRA